jgi:hypothetical protein
MRAVMAASGSPEGGGCGARLQPARTKLRARRPRAAQIADSTLLKQLRGPDNGRGLGSAARIRVFVAACRKYNLTVVNKTPTKLCIFIKMNARSAQYKRLILVQLSIE